ncbi:MAG: HEAT repeat domain-containing protein, partial [Armatimonadetes bacterium]|nr:HEAT repeat domain-containing protein [Armatimonadota bacterium]
MRSNCCFAVCAICLIAISALPLYPAQADGTGGASYTAEQISSTSAEVFLDRMLNQEPGYWQFAALNALIQKAKDADAVGRQYIRSLVVTVMKDKTRAIYQRWQCCYVISGSRDEPGVPDLIDVLLRDESEVMRSVAAEALGKLSGRIKAARDALLQAARTETSERVRETIAKYLGKDMPALEPSPLPPPGSVVVPSPRPPAPIRIIVPSPAFPRPIRVIGPSPAQRNSANVLLQQIWGAAPGKPKFDAIDAVVRTLKDMDAADRSAILSIFVSAMKGGGLTITQRWPCCYVISRS